MNVHSLFSATLLILAIVNCSPCALGSDEKPAPAKATAHELMNLEGWQVHVDRRLLNSADSALGKKALRVIIKQLFEITLMVDNERLKRLQQVHIWLDMTHGPVTSVQYHPDAGWLKENGFSPDVVKCVHIPNAACFVETRLLRHQPCVMFHELAHAYHDQVLDFENPEIMEAWKRFVDSGRYKSVLHISGKTTDHYALTNQKEFFAEMTESYFGMNDFFPFNSAELKKEEPEIFGLLQKIWGPLP